LIAYDIIYVLLKKEIHARMT